eukprot:SAG31_NODE_44281_length_263_cov_0.945122_1_plen_77_part_00
MYKLPGGCISQVHRETTAERSVRDRREITKVDLLDDFNLILMSSYDGRRDLNSVPVLNLNLQAETWSGDMETWIMV